MRLTCSACGASASLDAAIAHEGAREAVIIALQLPAPLGKLLVQYVALFRPATRQLSLDRLAALLGELLPLIEAGRIERGGRIWAVPLDAWKAALEDMIAKRDKLTLPLKSHGYLLEVIAGQAGKVEAAAETRKEAGARGVTPVGTHASHRDFKPPKKAEKSSPESAKAWMAGVKEALKPKGEQE
jgi:hypothetical protein